MNMNFLKRIYRLLLPEERKTGGKVAAAVFLTALLDFVGLAALLPVLYYLLEGGENQQAALWFCLLAVGVILFKSVLGAVFSRFQNRYLMSLYRRLSFSLFSAYKRKQGHPSQSFSPPPTIQGSLLKWHLGMPLLSHRLKQ